MKLIDEIYYGKNQHGYTIAHVDCHAKELEVAGYGIANHTAQVLIRTTDKRFKPEWVYIPFEQEDGEFYTILHKSDKRQIIIFIAPIDFFECH